MAYYRKRSGGWRAEVEKNGVRDSDTFPTKAQAVAWATKREAEIMAGARGELPRKYVSDALKKYAEEVSPNKKGKRWEIIRIRSSNVISRSATRLSAKSTKLIYRPGGTTDSRLSSH